VDVLGTGLVAGVQELLVGCSQAGHLTTREVTGGQAVGRVVEPGPVEASLHAAAVGGEPHRV
jgi:hypothetical protein